MNKNRFHVLFLIRQLNWLKSKLIMTLTITMLHLYTNGDASGFVASTCSRVYCFLHPFYVFLLFPLHSHMHTISARASGRNEGKSDKKK